MPDPRDGDQYILRLPGLIESGRLPWEGRSPRVLTAGFVRFTLKAQAAKSTSDFVSCDQLEMFREHQKRLPRGYGGAPSLRELPRRV